MKRKPVIRTLNQLKTAIENVVEYNWKDEEEDYKENPAPNHIFLSLQALNTWVEEN